MPVSIRFEKAKVEKFLDALANGTPIENVKSADDVLALAGACFFSALSRSASIEQGAEDEDEESRSEDAFIADLHAAIEYYAQLSMVLATGDYDQSFEPYHQAVVHVEADGTKTVVPIEGMKGDALEATFP